MWSLANAGSAATIPHTRMPESFIAAALAPSNLLGRRHVATDFDRRGPDRERLRRVHRARRSARAGQIESFLRKTGARGRPGARALEDRLRGGNRNHVVRDPRAGREADL